MKPSTRSPPLRHTPTQRGAKDTPFFHRRLVFRAPKMKAFPDGDFLEGSTIRTGKQAAMEQEVKLGPQQRRKKSFPTNIVHTLLENLTMETPLPPFPPKTMLGYEKSCSLGSVRTREMLFCQHFFGGRRGAPAHS